jgi:hypothetical protein
VDREHLWLSHTAVTTRGVMTRTLAMTRTLPMTTATDQLTTSPLSSPPSSRMSSSPPTNGPNGFSSSPSPSSIPAEIHLSIRLYASRGWPVTYFQKALLEYLQPLDLFWLLCSAHRVLKFLIGNTSILTIVYHATLLSGPSPRPPDSGIEDMNQPPF